MITMICYNPSKKKMFMPEEAINGKINILCSIPFKLRSVPIPSGF